MKRNNKAFKHTSSWANVCMINVVANPAGNTKYQTHNCGIFGTLIPLNKSLHSKQKRKQLTWILSHEEQELCFICDGDRITWIAYVKQSDKHPQNWTEGTMELSLTSEPTTPTINIIVHSESLSHAALSEEHSSDEIFTEFITICNFLLLLLIIFLLL